MSALRTVIVDRSTWLRGEGTEASKLLRAIDSKMCCLGSACLKAGLKEQQIIDQGSPWLVSNVLQLVLSGYFGSGFYQTGDNLIPLMKVNDNMEISDIEREAELIRLGPAAGILFQFVNCNHGCCRPRV